MSEVEVTSKGDLERLQLEPGDTLVFTVNDVPRMTADMVATLKKALSEKFPGHEVIVVAHGRLSTVAAS